MTGRCIETCGLSRIPNPTPQNQIKGDYSHAEEMTSVNVMSPKTWRRTVEKCDKTTLINGPSQIRRKLFAKR